MKDSILDGAKSTGATVFFECLPQLRTVHRHGRDLVLDGF